MIDSFRQMRRLYWEKPRVLPKLYLKRVKLGLVVYPIIYTICHYALTIRCELQNNRWESKWKNLRHSQASPLQHAFAYLVCLGSF